MAFFTSANDKHVQATDNHSSWWLPTTRFQLSPTALPKFRKFIFAFALIIVTATIVINSALLGSELGDYVSVFHSYSSPTRNLSSVLTSDVYTAHFPRVTRENVSNALFKRLSEAIEVHIPASFPPKSIRVTSGVTTEISITNRGYIHTDDPINPLCIPSETDPLCFTALPNAFFSGTGVAIDVVSATLYEISGGCCCMLDWKFLDNQTISLSSNAYLSYRQNRFLAIVVLGQHHGVTYHHVLYEVIPRYLMALPIIEANPTVLVAIDKSDITISLLLKLGLNRSRIIAVDHLNVKKWYGAGLLIFPPPVSQHEYSFPINPKLELNVVSDIIRMVSSDKSLPQPQHNSSKPILLLMERAQKRTYRGHCSQNRCLKNFAQLRSAIEQTFPSLDVKLFPAVADMDTAISLFSSARVVVGIHGAGFQNVMFCRPNTTVIHMGFGGQYQWLSRAFKLSHHIIIIPGLTRNSRSTEIDVSSVLPQITAALEKDGVLA